VTDDAPHRPGYELAVEDRFDGDRLDDRIWFPYHLPHWSSRARAAARYVLTGGQLQLLIHEDQQPWCPEFDGQVRVSSLQTGVFAGPLGSSVGQHRFAADAVVREEQPELRLFTPQYGVVEMRAAVPDDPRCMAALWMIGIEDRPERSAEICVAEIFGRDVGPRTTRVGMGLHPFGDPEIVNDFTAEPLPIDAREFHVYSVEWTPERVAFSVDGQHVRTVHQSPGYPMQIMLGLYEFPPDDPAAPAGRYPERFTVDWFRAYRPVSDR
jgi:hypothetical protein